MKWLVVELQTFPESQGGGMTSPAYAFDTLASAESKYHAILSSAAVSKLPTHAAVLLQNDGIVLASKSYTHESEGA